MIIKCYGSKSVSWKDEVNLNQNETEKPPDEEFKAHFNRVVFPEGSHPLNVAEIMHGYETSIPSVDSVIEHHEWEEVIREQVKPNKSGGPDGLSPGIFRLLPAQFILFMTMLFNLAFYAGLYPTSWMYAKLSMLFKKGDKMSCDNYRVISIINIIAKIYNYVLYNLICFP